MYKFFREGVSRSQSHNYIRLKNVSLHVFFPKKNYVIKKHYGESETASGRLFFFQTLEMSGNVSRNALRLSLVS